ncbi:hypothetical protein BD311DRAFT_665411, partial [Dichomitus squalens]
SSGGSSNFYPTTDYQAAAVSVYLAAHGSKNARREGRPFLRPRTKRVLFHGIECRQPDSGKHRRLSDRPTNTGKPPLCFLDPWLYSEDFAAFTDITTGNNSSRFSQNVTAQGYDAEVGWDQVCLPSSGEYPLC